MTDTAATHADAPEALYNRYRPRRLSDLVGQEHVTVPLQRAFAKGAIFHAYLLSGPRGCGKTSTARILAAGLVCETGPTADPCNTCDQCVQVIGGRHIDVIEMDAASNGGVDDARELREKAQFSPAIGRYKVVVVDEAHMVTAAAFNALLKLIEEPPPHVRFIFATTNPEKVLGTIRSRTHHYAFRLVPVAALAAHLEMVVAKENGTLEAGVLPLILRAGGGSMRDSLSLLGQLLDGSEGGQVRLDEAAALLGATADHILDGTVAALAARDTPALLSTIGAAIDGGTDPRRLGEEILDRLRDLLAFAATGVLPPLAEIASADQQALWRSTSERLGVRGLTSVCEVFQTATNSHSNQPRITLEVAAARALLSLADSVDVHAALTALTAQVAALAAAGPGLPAVYGGSDAHIGVLAGVPPVAGPGVNRVSPTVSQPVAPTTPAGQASPPANPEPAHQPAQESAPQQAAPVSQTPAPESADTAAASAPTPAGPTGQYGPADWDRVLVAVGNIKRTTWMLLNSTVKGVRIETGRIILGAAPGFEQGFRNGIHDANLIAAATEVLGGTWTIEVKVSA